MLRTAFVFVAALAAASCSKSAESSSSADPQPSESPVPATVAAPSPAATPSPATTPSPAAKPALIDIPNARIVDGMLLGGAPTPDQLRAAGEAGYHTVIDLRTPQEGGVAAEKELVAELGMHYVAVPVAGAAGLTDANVHALDKAIREQPGPVVVHCASGNRVGALLALRAASVDGMSPDKALELGKRAGVTRLEPAVRAKLGLTGDNPATP